MSAQCPDYSPKADLGVSSPQVSKVPGPDILANLKNWGLVFDPCELFTQSYFDWYRTTELGRDKRSGDFK